jgi:hypothetical protein
MKRILQLAALSISLSLTGQTYQVIIPVNCGDPCSPNGDRSGCRCEGRRDICTCINGHWSTLL